MVLSNPRLEDVVGSFGLGEALSNWQRVPGGLSNHLWRLDTKSGSFAIKRMVAGTENPRFKQNVNPSFEIERAAIAQGVTAPRPVPPLAGTGCLASIPCDDGEECWVRVHEWVDGAAVDHRTMNVDSAKQLGGLVASIHTLRDIPERKAETLVPTGLIPWESLVSRAIEDGSLWSHRCDVLVPVLARLEARIQSPESGRVVCGHRDLDDKNTLITRTGTLIPLDWDAAGPVDAHCDVTSLLLDWSSARTEEPRDATSAALVEGYAAAGGLPWRPDPSGWISAQLDWLAFNLRRALGDFGKPDVQTGAAELNFFFDHLPRIEASLDRWLDSWAGA